MGGIVKVVLGLSDIPSTQRLIKSDSIKIKKRNSLYWQTLTLVNTETDVTNGYGASERKRFDSNAKLYFRLIQF